MIFTLKELTKLIGCSIFEILSHVISVLVFSVFVTLKIDGNFGDSLSWTSCFIPLFCADSLNAYFCLILFIGLYKINDLKQAVLIGVKSTPDGPMIWATNGRRPKEKLPGGGSRFHEADGFFERTRRSSIGTVQEIVNDMVGLYETETLSSTGLF